MNAKSLLILGCLLAAALPASPAWAERRGMAEGDGVSLDEAVRRARGKDRRVMSARTLNQEGRRVHVIRALTPEGRVQRFEMDADRDGPRERRRDRDR